MPLDRLECGSKKRSIRADAGVLGEGGGRSSGSGGGKPPPEGVSSPLARDSGKPGR